MPVAPPGPPATPGPSGPSPHRTPPGPSNPAVASGPGCWLRALPRQLARTRRFRLGTPSQFTVSPEGGTVFFLRSRGGTDPANCLWALDVATATERLLADPLVLLAGRDEELSPQEQIRRERARQMASGIVGYTTDEACELIVFALSGQLWTVRPAGQADAVVRRITAAAEPVIDPHPDPAGQRIAYVSDGALHVVPADGDGPDRIVAAPDGDEVTFGLPEHVAAEEMRRDRGYWWAPDGHQILLARVDTSGVQHWFIADPANPASPPTAFPYPVAGSANAEVSLWIADLTGDSLAALTAVDWDTAGFEYLTSAGWDAFGPYASVQSRNQRHVVLLGIDAATGAIRTLSEQRDDCWVQLVPGLPARTAAGLLLTSADSQDTRRLLADGQPVTPPGLQLDSVLAIDGETVLFAASDEPTELHLWAWEPGSGLRRVSDGPGFYSGTTRAGVTVLESGSLDRLGSQVSVQRHGHADIEISSHAEQPSLEPRQQLLRLGPRELRAALFLPSWYQPEDGPLPVLMDPYGGPAMAKVIAAHWPASYVSQWFAEQGFAVLVVDGRGTPGRGPAWEREIYLDLAGPVLEDQISALQEAAAANPALDLTRVAIRGWSFGGFLAALAVLRRPDVFHAAVAGAPVTDQRLYDTHWRERHLGHPDEHPEAYDRCSPILEAASLRRPLLLVHGLADDNVFAAHTLRFSAALVAAGRPHEVLPLPRTTHMPADEAVAENVLLHQLEFLQRSLGLDPSVC